MAELLARVNDRTEHPDRPWIVEDVRNGKNSGYIMEIMTIIT